MLSMEAAVRSIEEMALCVCFVLDFLRVQCKHRTHKELKMNEYEHINVSIDFFARDTRPATERYGFGQLEVGRAIVVRPMKGDLTKIKALVNSHATYHRKKFLMRTEDGALYIMRIK